MENAFKLKRDKIILSAFSKSELIKNSEGYRCFQTLGVFRNSFFIYKNNFISWNKTLKNYYADEQNSKVDSIKRHFRQRGLITKVHNVLSSATSFLEMNHEYLFNDTFYCFIKELRNFTVHFQYLPLTSKWVYNLEEKKYEIFQVEKFQEYLNSQIQKYPRREGLKLAKCFLLDNWDSFNLYDLLNRYDEKLNDFYRDYIIKYIYRNRTVLTELIVESEKIHNNLLKVNIVTKFPLTQSQIRYLKWVISV